MGEGLLLALRVLVSLGVVLGLIWFAGRRLGAGRVERGTNEPAVRVVGRQALGRHAGVAVLAVGERRLLLGYGEQHVSMLSELDPVPDLVLEPEPAAEPGSTIVRRELGVVATGQLTAVPAVPGVPGVPTVPPTPAEPASASTWPFGAASAPSAPAGHAAPRAPRDRKSVV